MTEAKITDMESAETGKIIDMVDGDGIRIDAEVNYLFQRCCDCGKRHRITFEWETKAGKPAVTLRYYSEPPESED